MLGITSIWNLPCATNIAQNPLAEYIPVKCHGQEDKAGGMQPVARGPKVTRELKLWGQWKVPCFYASIAVLQVIANPLWVANELSKPQSLTHAAVARGPI